MPGCIGIGPYKPKMEGGYRILHFPPRPSTHADNDNEVGPTIKEICGRILRLPLLLLQSVFYALALGFTLLIGKRSHQ